MARKKRSISYRDIKKVTRMNSPNNWKELEELIKDKILDTKTLNTSKRTDTRKKFRLSNIGKALADKFAASALNCDELKILHSYNRIYKHADKKIKNDFLAIMDLFNEFGFYETASDLTELIRNFLRQARKFFSYQSQSDYSMRTLEKTALNN